MQDPDRGAVRNGIPERRQQGPVELDREDLRRTGVGEGDGQGAHPGADLDHTSPGDHAGVGGDGAGEVRIQEEVLAQRLGGIDAEAGGPLAELLSGRTTRVAHDVTVPVVERRDVRSG